MYRSRALSGSASADQPFNKPRISPALAVSLTAARRTVAAILSLPLAAPEAARRADGGRPGRIDARRSGPVGDGPHAPAVARTRRVNDPF